MTDAYTATLAADTIRESSLYNKDLAPVSVGRRTWRTYNYAALWISMSVNIPTYMLASGMIAGGMNWKQALFTVFLGNVLVLIPMLLTAHAGARYGIPSPVFARASFGVLGANIPAILRALVACGWCGIQTWIGGEAINAMLVALAPSWGHFAYGPAMCFAAFWLLNVIVILRGIETIRFLQGVSAPFLLLIGLALLLWARNKAGGFGPMLASPSKFQSFGEFFRFFVPSLTGVVGFWATVSLNIPDFTRYARSQRDQMVGHAQRQRGRQRRFSRKRFLESFSAPHQLSHRRTDYLRDGNRHAAVEAAGQLRQLHFYLAGGLFRFPGAHCRCVDLRLLCGAQENSLRGGSLPARRALRVFARDQLASHCRVGSGRGSRVRRPCLSSRESLIQLRMVRRVPGQLRYVFCADGIAAACGTTSRVRKARGPHEIRDHHQAGYSHRAHCEFGAPGGRGGVRIRLDV